MKKEVYNYGELLTRGRMDYSDCRIYLCNNGFIFYYEEDYDIFSVIGHLDYDASIFATDNPFQWENEKTFKPINIKDYSDVKFTDKFLIDNDDSYEFTLKYEDLKINGIYIDNEYQVFVVENGEPITNKKIGKEFALLIPLTNERYYTYIAPDDEDNEVIEEEFNLNVWDAQGLPPKSIFLSDIGLIWQIVENKKGSTDVKLIGSIYFDINDYPEARQNWFNYDPLLQRYKVLFLGDRRKYPLE